MTLINTDYMWKYRPILLNLMDILMITRPEAKDAIEVFFKHMSIVSGLLNDIVDASGAAEVAISRAKKRLRIAGRKEDIDRLDELMKIIDEGTGKYIESLKSAVKTLYEIIFSMVVLYNKLVPPAKKVELPPPPTIGGREI